MPGCLVACSDAMGLGHSLSWVFGGTGYAFLMNFDESVCPSHPTAWNKELLFANCENLGMRIIRVFEEDGKTQEDAWKAVRESIDDGRAAFAWEMQVPEFYVINGKVWDANAKDPDLVKKVRSLVEMAMKSEQEGLDVITEIVG
jgi:hypothetical protein